MTQFYKEITPSGFGIAIKQKEVLFSEQSPFQKVDHPFRTSPAGTPGA